MELSTSMCPSLSEEQIESLKSAGVVTLTDFIFKNKRIVTRAGFLSFPEYESVVQELAEIIRPVPVTAQQLVVNPISNQFYVTGISKLDSFLDGGLCGDEVLEIYGENRTGKTQICLSVAAQFCHFREDKLSVVYFDLKQDFRASRFLEFCEGAKQDLRNILIIRPTSIVELISEMKDLKEDISRRQNKFFFNLKLMIFDSVPMGVYPAVNDELMSWRFYEEQFFETKSELSKLNGGIMSVLVNHAVKPRLDVTGNEIVSSESQSAIRLKPALGKYWTHKPNFRVRVSEKFVGDSKNSFTGILEKSSRSRTDNKKIFNYSIEKSGITCD